jgi:hypothetical protein
MRYELEPKERERYVCFVGYDRTHRTFFVYVAHKGETDRSGKLTHSNHVVMWFGTGEREITSVDEVKSLIGEYAELPARVEQALRACVEDEKGIERQGAGK